MAKPDQFIVDNEDEQWKSLEYLRQWCEISQSIDIATGHFEIGAFLALDGAWQRLDKLRILIGGETSRRTADVIAAALDASIKVERQTGDMFLTGVDAVVDGIRSGKIEIRTYPHRKFHAKAYITHGRLEVVGSAALVGSSNFTRPGLTQNVELNVRFQGPEVADLQKWYEDHWQDAEPVSDELLKVLEHNARQFTPFEVYIKSLHALTSDMEASDKAWEESESKIYPLLAPYQREAYHDLLRMAQQWRGGFLTDGVGLGKTFVGLMLAEYYAVKKRRNVLILATKTGEEAVWLPDMKSRLPHLFGQFTNVSVMAHTDLQRQNAPELVQQLRDRVDVVIVDEAHNFRNHGREGGDDDARQSRWWRLQKICQGKTVFLLTATPINNSFFDLVHQAELFTGMQDDYFATVGVPSLVGYVNRMEKPFRTAGSVDLTEFDKVMAKDQWLQSIIHQSSRRYAEESARVAGASRVLFPETQVPKVVDWHFGLIYRKLLDELSSAFEKDHPLFVLPMYYPLAFSTKPEIDALAENRQKQVVALIRTTFLKRFESSVAAFAGSCMDLSANIIKWLQANTTDAPEYAKRLENWRQRNEPLLQQLQQKYRPTAEIEPWNTDDMTEEELGELDLHLMVDDYRWQDMLDAAFEDLTQLGRFLERIADAGDADDKYEKLLRLINPSTHAELSPEDQDVMTPEFRTQKVLVFTEFADTARYLQSKLTNDGVPDVDRLDGSRGGDRFAMIKRFAPFYNGVNAHDRAAQSPLRVLVSTDVLSEGVNLQDGTLLVNYDLHWNPVRLMQRIGRVDRRLTPEIEEEMLKAHPELKASRGHVQVRNFVPPLELDDLLSLYQRVQNKVLRISKTLGIPGGKFLSEHDMLDDVKVFAAFTEEYEGDLSPLETLRLKWQKLVAERPDLAKLADALPDGISTAKTAGHSGVFLCRRLPIRVKDEDGDDTTQWSLVPGRIQWSFLADKPEHGLEYIDALIASDEDTPTAAFSSRGELGAKLRDFERDETKAYRKAVQLPLDAPTPETLCWMEVR